MFRKKVRKVLVVGHKGFIGSHLMDNTHSGLENCLMYGLDIKDGPISDVRGDAWAEKDYDVIVFLACDFRESVEGYTENARMLAQVAAYLEAHPRTHVIYTSSAAVYPDGYKSMKEEDVLPEGSSSYYGQAKLLGEMGLAAATHRVTILRLSNVYGEGGRGVADLIKRGSRIIFGTGTIVRDYINVEFVVQTIRNAIKHPKKWTGTFNVSTGQGLTVLDIYKDYGKGSPIFKKGRPGDVKFSVLDNTKWLDQWK